MTTPAGRAYDECRHRLLSVELAQAANMETLAMLADRIAALERRVAEAGRLLGREGREGRP